MKISMVWVWFGLVESGFYWLMMRRLGPYSTVVPIYTEPIKYAPIGYFRLGGNLLTTKEHTQKRPSGTTTISFKHKK